MFTIAASYFVFDIHNFSNVSPSFNFSFLLEIFENLILIFSPVLSFHGPFSWKIIITFTIISHIWIIKEYKDGLDPNTILLIIFFYSILWPGNSWIHTKAPFKPRLKSHFGNIVLFSIFIENLNPNYLEINLWKVKGKVKLQ